MLSESIVSSRLIGVGLFVVYRHSVTYEHIATHLLRTLDINIAKQSWESGYKKLIIKFPINRSFYGIRFILGLEPTTLYVTK